jgi:signal transduction histidine kinase
LLSLFFAFFITTYLYQRQAVNQIENETLKTGKEIIQLYENSTHENIDSFFNGVTFFNYNIFVVNSSGNIRSYGKDIEKFKVAPNNIRKVLQGEVYRGFSSEKRSKPKARYVGIPLNVNGELQAMFLQPKFDVNVKAIHKVLFTLIGVVIGFGSVLILISSRFIVNPIVKLTRATEQLSVGNYNVKVDVDRKDELGVLAKSFTNMANELQKIEQMRQDFVSNVSHEFKTPLTSIKGLAIALNEEELTPTQRKQYLSIIEMESDRLTSLTSDLLKLASLESEHHPLHLTEFLVDKQIRDLLIQMQQQWLGKEIEFDLELDKVNFIGDEDLLRQVWSNLISNSIKYSNESSKIYVSLKLDRDLVFTIRDSGIGIADEDLPYIFEKFYKADKSHSRSVSGHGVGLAIVKRIVELHKGNIKVSSNLNKGTEIIIQLPVIK